MSAPLRVSLTGLKANLGVYLECARTRRVLITRRGRVVGELVPVDEAPLTPELPFFEWGYPLGAPVDGVDLASRLTPIGTLDAERRLLPRKG